MKFYLMRGKDVVGEAVKLGNGYSVIFYNSLYSPAVMMAPEELKKKRLKLAEQEKGSLKETSQVPDKTDKDTD